MLAAGTSLQRHVLKADLLLVHGRVVFGILSRGGRVEAVHADGGGSTVDADVADEHVTELRGDRSRGEGVVVVPVASA